MAFGSIYFVHLVCAKERTFSLFFIKMLNINMVCMGLTVSGVALSIYNHFLQKGPGKRRHSISGSYLPKQSGIQQNIIFKDLNSAHSLGPLQFFYSHSVYLQIASQKCHTRLFLFMHSDVCDVDGKTVNVHADLFLRCFASIDISMLCVIRFLLVTKWSAAIFFLFGLSRIKRAKKTHFKCTWKGASVPHVNPANTCR